jgi:uncharacterized RDD family membrane protein YckC
MAMGIEGTPWPEPAQGTRFTWGPPSEDQRLPEVRYATWGRRGLGFLVDFLLMAPAPIVFDILFGASVPNNANAPMSLISWVWFWCLLASLTVFVLYPVWFIGRRGQTPGMRRMQIRLFHMNGEGNLEAPSRKRAWGRAVTAFVCWLLFVAWILDYLWPLGDQRHQCLHDKFARTVAVDVRDTRHECGVDDGDGSAAPADAL